MMGPEGSPAQYDCVVIGAGLAGCHTARALTDNSKKVLVIERDARIANRASGNPAGILQPLLNRTEDLAARYYNLAFQRALQSSFYQQARVGPAGVLFLAHTADWQERFSRALQQPQIQAMAQAVDPSRATQLAGLEVAHGGVYFAGAHLVQPRELCAHLLDHPAIDLQLQQGALQLQPVRQAAGQAAGWDVQGDQGSLARATQVVLAQASAARELRCSAWLPIYPVRGQLLYLPASAESRRLRCTLAYDGYATPAILEGVHLVGATFEHWNTAENLIPQQQQRLFQRLRAVAPGFPALDQQPGLDFDRAPGRVAFRTAARDRMPLIGPLPDLHIWRAGLQQVEGEAQPYLPGLFVNLAHGSRGLSGTLLAAQWLAELMCKQTIADPDFVALWPERFLRRALRKGQSLDDL